MATVAAADDDEAVRSLFELQYGLIGQVVDAIQAFYGGYQRARAGGDEDLFAFDFRSVNLDGVRGGEMPGAFVKVQPL